MIFRLENLIPLPMLEIPVAESRVWEAESFRFEPGKSYLVEAPSGKGKTSLLSIMYGLRKDFRGELFINDSNSREINDRHWSEFRKKKLSFIFQGLELFDELSGMDNILLKNQVTQYRSQKQIMEMADKLDIEGFLDKKCGILSFGQRQRVAIIRALCQPFEFLFADECFSHIDEENGARAMELIRAECNRQNAGFILTSLGNMKYSLDETVNL